MSDPVNRASLDTLGRDFVKAGTAAEKLQETAERNRTRRLRRLVAALTVLVLVTIGLTAYAFRQRQAATTARNTATSAMNTAESREVAIEADEIRGQNTALAAQLSMAAYRIAATSEARASLLESTGTPAASRLIDTAGVIQAISLSPDHRVLAVAAADGTLRLWNVARPGHPVPLGRPLLARNQSAPLYAVAFSPHGRTLVAAGATRHIWLWNVSHPEQAVRYQGPLTGPAGTVYSLAFSPGGKVLAAGSADKTVRLWTVTNPARAAPVGQPLTGPGALVTSVAFSPDSKTLAVGSQDHKVWLWRVARPAHPVPAGTLTGASDWVNTVSFGPGGGSLAAGSSDDRVLVWNLATRALTAPLPNPQPVTSLGYASGHQLFGGDADGTVRAWQLPAPVLRAGGEVYSVAYSAGGRYLAVGGTDLQLWDPARRLELATQPAPGPADNVVNAVALRPALRCWPAGTATGSCSCGGYPGPGR